jgi:phage-related protein
VDPIVRTVTSVTSKLPPPVGPAATKAVQTAGSAVKKVIKHLPSTAGSVVDGAGSAVNGVASTVKSAGSAARGLLPKAHVPKLPLG